MPQLTSPIGMASTSAGLLYVGSSDSAGIERFAIDWNTGKLANGVSLSTAIGSAPSWISALTVIPCGSLLHVAGKSHFTQPDGTTYTGWGFSILNLNSDGTISTNGSFGFATNEPDPVVSNLALDSSCKYMIRAQTYFNTVEETSFDISTHHEQGYIPVPAGTAPVAVAADSTFKFLYVANSGSNNVSAYTVDAPSGTLTPVAGSPFAAGGQPSYVLIVQSWVYVTNSADNTVSAYSRDANTGVLVPVPGSPFTVGTAPAGMVAATTDLSHSPSGMLLYVANQGANNVGAFVIGSDGSLQAVAGSPFATGAAPKGMVVAVGPQ